MTTSDEKLSAESAELQRQLAKAFKSNARNILIARNAARQSSL